MSCAKLEDIINSFFRDSKPEERLVLAVKRAIPYFGSDAQCRFVKTGLRILGPGQSPPDWLLKLSKLEGKRTSPDGRYDASIRTIEIYKKLNMRVMLHELAHAYGHVNSLGSSQLKSFDGLNAADRKKLANAKNSHAPSIEDLMKWEDLYIKYTNGDRSMRMQGVAGENYSRDPQRPLEFFAESYAVYHLAPHDDPKNPDCDLIRLYHAATEMYSWLEKDAKTQRLHVHDAKALKAAKPC